MNKTAKGNALLSYAVLLHGVFLFGGFAAEKIKSKKFLPELF